LEAIGRHVGWAFGKYKMHDIAIIGAGPAGATLARLIGKQYKVLLVDKRPFIDQPDSIESDKCCGGLLAPDAQKMLSKLGLGLPMRVLEEPQLFVVRAMDLQRRVERYYQRHYINMNRRKFDGWLVSLVPPNVDLRTGVRLISFDRVGGGFNLKLTDGDSAFEETAKVLVGADGASSRVGKPFFTADKSARQYVAIQEWVEADGIMPYFSSFFDPAMTDFYGWTIPKGEHVLIGVALAPKDNPNEKFDYLKNRLKENGLAFGQTIRREGALMIRPTSLDHVSTGGRGVALIGEAGGWISPSSAEGLSYAFKTAVLLAESLQSGLNGFEKRYYENTRTLKFNLFLKNQKSRFIFNPTLRHAIMKTGIQSMKPL
jgi:geranylgeranyl reductase